MNFSSMYYQGRLYEKLVYPSGSAIVWTRRPYRSRTYGPKSDGTMLCPARPKTHPDLRCTKRIPKGWLVEEGHGGGHWFMSDRTRDMLGAGAHFDARLALAGLPFTMHLPSDCPEDCPKR